MRFSVHKISDEGFGKANEDTLLAKKNLFAVFDGASSLVPYKDKSGKTGARLAAEITRRVFSSTQGSLRVRARIANDTLRKKMNAAGVQMQRKEELWGTAVAAIQLHRNFIEYLSITDCLLFVFLRDGSYRLLTRYHDHDADLMMQSKKLGQKKVRNIWKKLKPKMDALRREANVTYGLLNGEKEAIHFLQHGKIVRKNVASIILFTDGFLIPKEDPRSPEQWNVFASFYRAGGLRSVLHYVRSLENSDPFCWKYPRVRKHDDATAIAIDFI